jgi:hypothetical protein
MSFVNPTPDSELDANRAELRKAELRTTDEIDYVERWEQVLRVLEGLTPHEREKHFFMGIWGQETACGTVACAAGHCALDPWFRERGFIGEFDSRFNNTLQFPKTKPAEFFGQRGHNIIRRLRIRCRGREGADRVSEERRRS